jgi:FMN reductase [NAD(P)H]
MKDAVSIAALLDARYGGDQRAHPVLEDPSLSRMLGRRTCRRYLAKVPPPEVIEALLDVAFASSSKSDYQQASVIVVEDDAQRQRIAALAPAMPWIALAPAFLEFCADARRLEQVCATRNRPARNRNIEALFNATVDAALVMQTYIVAAETIGLGCCPISVIRNRLSELRAILSLPERVLPVAGLCVGYPADAGTISRRLPRRLTRHRDTYDEGDFAATIDRYDRERAKDAPIPPGKQRAPERFGTADFYGWSEDKARQMHEHDGAAFGAMVRDAGFTLE